MKINKSQIEYKKTSELVPYENNARIHTEKQVKQVMESIREFGFTNPILVDKNNGIIAGHCRVMAADKLKIEKVPIIRLEHLTEKQKKAYVIADNKIALNSEWDNDLLKGELSLLKDGDFDLNLIGFDDDEIDLLTDTSNDFGLNDEDHVPDVEDGQKPITKSGDVWILGNHRLLCGDSTNAEEVERLLSGAKPNLMVTDPPYGVDYDAGKRARDFNRNPSSKEKTAVIQNDDRADWYETYDLFKGNIAYVWHASTFVDIFMNGLKKAGFEINAQIIWNKKLLVIGHGDYQWKHEPCLYAIRKGANHSWKGGRDETTVWDIDNILFEKVASEKTNHPTQKPVEIYTKPIINHTKEGEYVYDPFAGSGSAIVACEKTNRCSLSIEIDPKFCDVIVKRWQDYTGKNAHLESNGEKFNDLEININVS